MTNDKTPLGKSGVSHCRSGRGDLNPGPRGPDPRALAELRYAPKVLLLYSIQAVWQG